MLTDEDQIELAQEKKTEVAILPSTAACRVRFNGRLWLTAVATAGLEEAAVNGPEDEGWLVRLMEIKLQSTTMNGVSNHGTMDAENGVSMQHRQWLSLVQWRRRRRRRRRRRAEALIGGRYWGLRGRKIEGCGGGGEGEDHCRARSVVSQQRETSIYR